MSGIIVTFITPPGTSLLKWITQSFTDCFKMNGNGKCGKGRNCATFALYYFNKVQLKCSIIIPIQFLYFYHVHTFLNSTLCFRSPSLPTYNAIQSRKKNGSGNHLIIQKKLLRYIEWPMMSLSMSLSKGRFGKVAQIVLPRLYQRLMGPLSFAWWID